MGKKGEKRTGAAKEAAEALVARLSDAAVTSRGMFGGYGIFHNGVMFAMVNSHGETLLRVDSNIESEFEAAGSAKHGRMPYYTVPDAIFASDGDLRAWAKRSAAVAHSSQLTARVTDKL